MPRVRIVYLPAGPDGAKVGLDDHLATGPSMGLLRHFREMAEDQLRPAPDTGDDALAPYEATPTGLVWHKPTREGSIQTPLTNFIAQIVSDVAEDDGAEVHHILEIEARLGEPLRLSSRRGVEDAMRRSKRRRSPGAGVLEMRRGDTRRQQ